LKVSKFILIRWRMLFDVIVKTLYFIYLHICFHETLTLNPYASQRAMKTSQLVFGVEFVFAGCAGLRALQRSRKRLGFGVEFVYAGRTNIAKIHRIPTLNCFLHRPCVGMC